MANEPALKIRPIVAAFALGEGIPAALALVLNFLRPDLMAHLLDSEFGPRMIFGEQLLCAGATGLYLLAGLVPFKTRTPRVLLALAGAPFFTMPALAGIVFGPIVFAFTNPVAP